MFDGERLNEFASGFVVTRYLLGARGPELERGLEVEPYVGGRALAATLGALDQRQRAEALANPLRTLVTAIEALYVRA